MDNQSLRLDMKILWLTVKKLVVKDGISAKGEAKMPAFTGLIMCKKLTNNDDKP